MISPEELHAKAEEFGIDRYNVQRDYMFGWVLSTLFGYTDLKDHVVLKGGNCLRKAYFPDTRFSNDIDLSCPEDLDPNFLKQEMLNLTGHLRQRLGVEFDDSKMVVHDPEQINRDLRVTEVHLFFENIDGAEEL